MSCHWGGSSSSFRKPEQIPKAQTNALSHEVTVYSTGLAPAKCDQQLGATTSSSGPRRPCLLTDWPICPQLMGLRMSLSF